MLYIYSKSCFLHHFILSGYRENKIPKFSNAQKCLLFSVIPHCPGQFSSSGLSARLSAVPDSAQCGLSAVPDSVHLGSALSQTMFGLTTAVEFEIFLFYESIVKQYHEINNLQYFNFFLYFKQKCLMFRRYFCRC